MTAATIDNATAQKIKKKLKSGGKVVLLGCGIAQDNETKALAQKIGVTVIANVSTVSESNLGDGDWYEFKP